MIYSYREILMIAVRLSSGRITYPTSSLQKIHARCYENLYR